MGYREFRSGEQNSGVLEGGRRFVNGTLLRSGGTYASRSSVEEGTSNKLGGREPYLFSLKGVKLHPASPLIQKRGSQRAVPADDVRS